MAAKEWIDAVQAGQIIKAARERISLTQEQVAEALAVDKSYISKLEGGQHHAGRSKYFPRFVSALRLTDDEIRVLNPAAVVTVEAPEPAFNPLDLFPPAAPQPREKRPLWPNLAQMIEEKQEKHPPLRETRWQQHLNQTRFSGGQEPDAEGWFEMYQTLRRNNVEPEAWPDDH